MLFAATTHSGPVKLFSAQTSIPKWHVTPSPAAIENSMRMRRNPASVRRCFDRVSSAVAAAVILRQTFNRQMEQAASRCKAPTPLRSRLGRSYRADRQGAGAFKAIMPIRAIDVAPRLLPDFPSPDPFGFRQEIADRAELQRASGDLGHRHPR